MKRLLISFMVCLGLAICCAGCTPPPADVSVPLDEPAQSTVVPEPPTSVAPPPPPPPVIPQQYAAEDFLVYWSDEVMFLPQIEDYILTEVYWQGNESYKTERLVDGEPKLFEQFIIYHRTTIQEFDADGKLIAERTRYIFQTNWEVPRDVYLQDMADREEYTNVKLVEQAIYADVAPDHLDTTKTKTELAAAYKAADKKFYMSIPISLE